MRYSIIIPTLNEERFIHRLISHVQLAGEGESYEIIVCDGGSSDRTVSVAAGLGVRTYESPKKGRAGQMNFAAAGAKGEILYFVHADCIPPVTFFKEIEAQLMKGADAGCFRYKFDSDKFMLRVNAFFNRFGGLICRGGDQTLFIKRTIFNSLGGFNETFTIMEDYDLVRSIRKQYRFAVIPAYAVVSSRKYEHNNWLQVNFANSIAMFMFISGACSPDRIKSTYHSLIRRPKDE